MVTIKLKLEINGDIIKKNVQSGTCLSDILKELNIENNYKIVAAKEGNEIRELTYKVDKDSHIKFIGVEDIDGFRIYARSLVFLLIKAVKDLYSDGDVYVSNSISDGTYCELSGINDVNQAVVSKIQNKMKCLVKENIPFNKSVLTIEKGKEFYKENGLLNKYNLIEYTDRKYITLYECDGLKNYFYGYMVPSTGYLNNFELVFYGKGLILRCPTVKNPKKISQFVEQKKIFDVFVEFNEWNNILGIDNVGTINKIIYEDNLGDYIRVAEALQEKKIANIADMICNSNKKIVLIAGPSSSGKTTFSKRLAVQLRVNKKRPVTIGLDDYFLNRVDTPRDEDGNLDYESIEALDLELIGANKW